MSDFTVSSDHKVPARTMSFVEDCETAPSITPPPFFVASRARATTHG